MPPRARRSRFFVTLLCIVSSFTGCSRYGQRISDADPLRPVIVLVPTSFETLKDKVSAYLKSRDRIESVFVPAGSSTEVRYNQRWVRDTSLRYYALEFDRRLRHIVQWKGQWIVRSVSPSITELRLNILEVIFLGPPLQAGPTPLLNNEWFETESDYLRAALELRRFWLENFPGQTLPAALANISVPSLAGEPVSKAQLVPRWIPSPRRRPF